MEEVSAQLTEAPECMYEPVTRVGRAEGTYKD